jgi:hypothetical protein
MTADLGLIVPIHARVMELQRLAAVTARIHAALRARLSALRGGR